MPNDKIKVLIVDDSKVARQFLTHLLESDPQIHVMGVVSDGQAAVDFVANERPDVVLMDIHMPRLDGFEATRHIMETTPVPIVICTGTADASEVAMTFRLLEAGALACVEKPVGPQHPNYEAAARNVLQTIKLMSEVKVIRRWPATRMLPPAPPMIRPDPVPGGAPIIGIGASTGGPPVLQTILAGLPRDFGAPILIVQHIAHGFLPGLVEWLNQTTAGKVQIAAHGTIPQPGHAYFSPDDFHMGLSPSGRIVLTREEPENGLRPAVSYLFRSLAASCGANAIGVLLSGMGRDGAAELKLMKDAGAATIAQNRESSVVHGMPGEAIKLGGATYVLSAGRIAAALMQLLQRKTFSGENQP